MTRKKEEEEETGIKQINSSKDRPQLDWLSVFADRKTTIGKKSRKPNSNKNTLDERVSRVW